MKIFLTGGTGFVGRQLLHLLVQRGHEVLVLSRFPCNNNYCPTAVTFVRGNLTDTSELTAIMQNFIPQALLHLAWEGLPDYSLEVSQRNFEYGTTLFSIAAKAGCPCILSLGSCWEYAERKGRTSEDDVPGYNSAFSVMKNALRLSGEAIAMEKGLRFYWLRPFFIYGPGQRQNSLIPYILNSIKKGREPKIEHPQNRNDFIFVEDVACAIIKVLDVQPKSSVYNVGSGYSTSVEDVVRMAYEAMNRQFDGEALVEQPVSRNTKDFWADTTRIRSDTGWQSMYDLKAGIMRTIEKNYRMVQ